MISKTAGLNFHGFITDKPVLKSYAAVIRVICIHSLVVRALACRASTREFESLWRGSFNIFMQVYKFYPNLMKFRKFSMTPLLSGNYRQDVILPLKLDCMESSKTLSKPLPFAAVCMKNAFQNCSTDILRYSIRSLKSELLKSIFWP